MASLTTPLSVRLSDKDTAFLAQFQVDGAVTASDKIRSLIRQARQRYEVPESFSDALAISHVQLSNSLHGIRVLEQSIGEHSDVAAGLMLTAEEFLALALSAPGTAGDDVQRSLIQYEARLVDCAARLTEQLLRWAVTPNAPAYDSKVVARRVAQLSDIMQLIISASAAR